MYKLNYTKIVLVSVICFFLMWISLIYCNNKNPIPLTDKLEIIVNEYQYSNKTEDLAILSILNTLIGTLKLKNSQILLELAEMNVDFAIKTLKTINSTKAKGDQI